MTLPTHDLPASVQEIAGLAALVCETPFAVLCAAGFDITWCSPDVRFGDEVVPLRNPFDAYALRCTDLFEVSDAAQDPRFAASMLHLDGQPLCFYAGVPLLAADGAILGTLAVLDVVRRCLTAKQRKALLSFARQAASQLSMRDKLIVAQARVENAPVAIYHADDRGKVVYANPEYRRFLGLGPAESLDNWANGLHADDRPRIDAVWAVFCRDPRPVAFEYRTAPREGASRVLMEQVVAAHGTAGFIGTITDVTERVDALAGLKRAETLFQNTFEQAPIGIVYADRGGKVLRGNQAFSGLLGFNAREIEMMSIAQLSHEADVARTAAEFERLWLGEIDVIDTETRYLRNDRRVVWVRVTTALLRHARGAATCAVMFIRDISVRKDLAAELLQNQRLLEAVIADIPVAVRACDLEGRVFLHNPAATEFFAMASADDSRIDALTRKPIVVDIFLPDGKTPVPREEQPLARALRGETVVLVDLVISRAGAAGRMTRSSARRLTGQNGESLGAVAITQDVTQQQKLERDLAHAQKLEAIGHLAAGIAHEINTPTQFIGDNVRFLQQCFRDLLGLVAEIKAIIAAAPADGAAALAALAAISAAIDAADLHYLQDEIPKAASQSLDGVGRIAKIVGAMKEFAHPSTAWALMDLNRAIASTITVASNEWKYVAVVKTEFDPQLPHVPVIAGSFNQVILNMIVNAAHAIEAAAPQAGSAAGTITVTTKHVGDWVEIGITDTGCGIPADTIPQIFDQFFTTKPVGKGTGQGLAIAHDIVVTKHGGTIAVASELGVGTTFTVRLPLNVPTVASAEAA